MIGKGLKKETALEGETNSLLLSPMWKSYQKGTSALCDIRKGGDSQNRATVLAGGEFADRLKTHYCEKTSADLKKYIYSRTFTALHL